jgi:hypothetical protein
VETLNGMKPEDRSIVLEALEYLFCEGCGQLRSHRDIYRLGISKTYCEHLIRVPAGIAARIRFDEERLEARKSLALEVRAGIL